MNIAQVIVNSSANDLNRIFDYKIPEGYEVGKNIDIGYRVLVSFANYKSLEIGYIIGFKENSEYKCKTISRVCDKTFDSEKLEIAKWMAKRYFCNFADVLKLLVPPGTKTKIDKVTIKYEKFVKLTDSYLMAQDEYKIKSDKQKRAIEFLIDNKEIPVSILCEVADVTPAVVKALEDKKICETYKMEVLRNPFFAKHVKRDVAPNLSKEQKDVVDAISIDKYNSYLIYGVTGSGKTEVYLNLIDRVIKENKTAIVLVPEISLTPQITDRFLARFGRIIAILHSKLSNGERYDEWRRINSGEAKIVIGARSALFAPISNLGIIIIDEEHDSSYKSETTPRYDAREVATVMAKKFDIPLVLGSATPDIRSYYKAINTEEIKLLKLENRISSSGMPEVKIVDMRKELAEGNKSVLSKYLYNELKCNLDSKEQTMLFLNRRGYSTFIMCRDCGYVVKCDKCDVAMTYHITKNKLLCHYCGAEKKNVSICPSCGSENIRYFGTGTQKIEKSINELFPDASIIRMDIDTTNVKNGHEIILNKFRDKKIDILLGTQMITKGHDFSNVTLVGVLAADSSMNISDYRAQERTFQLITQVCGRAGRGDKKGRAVIQTYMPEEFVIQMAAKQDYLSFYKSEIKVREKLNYPPFCDIMIAVLIGQNESVVKKDARLFYSIFKDHFELFNPMPAPISKVNDNFRWRVLGKFQLNEKNIDLINICLDNFEQVKSKDTKLNFDINPNNMN